MRESLFPIVAQARGSFRPRKLVRRRGTIAPVFELLERRELLSAAFDLIGLTAMRADPLYADIDGTGFSVAVIDTGLDATHPLLAPNYLTGRDFVFGGSDPTPVDPHGTHVAGTVGAADPDIGVATDVGLIGLQVFHPLPGGETSAGFGDIQRALQWVLENREQFNIVAVNMSIGDGGHYKSAAGVGVPGVTALINELEAVGVTVVSAAGNFYPEEMTPNASYPGVVSTINVGAVWETNEGPQIGWEYSTDADRLTAFSQRPVLSNGNVLFAPGALINSTMPGNDYAELAGTSMASPMVAGAVALLQEAATLFGGRTLSPEEVRGFLLSTADLIFDGDDEDSVAPFRYTNLTYPRMNIYSAVQEVRNFFLGIAPTPVGGGAGDPNGTLAGAYLIYPALDGSASQQVIGSIGTDGASTLVGNKDVDMFRFEVASPGLVTVALSTRPDAPQDFDTLLRLFNSSGQEIAFNDDGQGVLGGFSRLDVLLDPGVYYVGVSGYNNDAYNPAVAGSGVAADTGNYLIDFSLTNDDPNGLVFGAVDVPLTGGYSAHDFDGTIGFDYGLPVGVSDVDLFRIVVPGQGNVYIDVDTPFSGYVDSFLRIFDANGQEVGWSDDDLDLGLEFASDGLVFDEFGNWQGHLTDSFISGFVDTPGEVFYIGISDFDNQFYDPFTLTDRATGGLGGDYQLTIEFLTDDEDGTIADALAFAPLIVPVAFTDFIGDDRGVDVGPSDVDMFGVQATATGHMLLDVDSFDLRGNRNAFDSVLGVFDIDGNVLAWNDDNDGLDPLVVLPVVAGQEYFVAVTGYGNHDFDPLQLGSGSGGETGRYAFTARMLNSSELHDYTNDALSSGRIGELRLGEISEGFIGSDYGLLRDGADVDLFRFEPTRSGRYRFNAAGMSALQNPDTLLRILDAAGNVIAENDDLTATLLDSGVSVDVLAGETYYAEVRSAVGQTGEYSVLASTLPTVTIRVADRTAGETDAGSFTIMRRGDLSTPLTVSYDVGGTATAGDDYQALSGSVTIPAGESRVTVHVAPLEDALAEAAETLVIDLLGGDMYQLSLNSRQNTASLSITDNEPTITLRATDRRAAETGGGTAVGRGSFAVSRRGDLTQPVLVSYIVDGGSTASSGSDYAALPGIVEIPAGAASAVIDVNPIEDDLLEGNETVTVQLLQGADYHVSTRSNQRIGTVAIADSDFAPSVVAGRTVQSIITSGSGVFASSGTFDLTLAPAGLSYILDGSLGVLDSFGSYTYQKLSKSSARITFSDSEVSSGVITLRFTAHRLASYSMTASLGGTQRGTMQFLPLT